MNKLFTLMFILFCITAVSYGQSAAKDSTSVSTEVVAEAQLKKLTRELYLSKEQQKDIFELLTNKNTKELESIVAWDDLMKLLTFQQNSIFLRLLELDKKSLQNVKQTTNLKSTTTADHSLTLNTSDKIKDVRLCYHGNPTYSYANDKTYNTYSKECVVAWTNGGYPMYFRTVINFVLDDIPAGSVIVSATLYFYSDPTITSSSSSDGNSQLSGSNEFYIERIVEPWSDQTVTWNNQPTSTTSNRLLIPASTSTTENIQIDLTDMVQTWVNTPAQNYGFKMLLQTEAHYRARNYGSMDHTNTSISPKLVVEYNNIESTIEYVYDDAGNREARQVVVVPPAMKSAKLTEELKQQPPITTDWNGLVVKVFPNPTAGDISLSFNGNLADELLNFQLYNATGRMVLDGKLNTAGLATLPISELPSGVYILVLKQENNQKSWKIIKQ